MSQTYRVKRYDGLWLAFGTLRRQWWKAQMFSSSDDAHNALIDMCRSENVPELFYEVMI